MHSLEPGGLSSSGGYSETPLAPQGRPAVMARRLLSEMGILGIDEMCVEALEALSPKLQRDVADKFVEALMNEDITNPSKWITLKCGRLRRKKSLARSRSRSDSPIRSFGDVREIPVKLDPRCVEKMEELDDQDRDILIKLFLRENERLEIQNPSGWLFARARSRICDKWGKGTGKSSKVWGENIDSLKCFARHVQQQQRPATVAEQARLELRRVALDYCVDEEPMQQMEDLTAQEQLALLSAFREEAKTQNWGAYDQVESSRWLSEKASVVIKEGLGVALGETPSRSVSAEKVPRVRNRTRQEAPTPVIAEKVPRVRNRTRQEAPPTVSAEEAPHERHRTQQEVPRTLSAEEAPRERHRIRQHSLPTIKAEEAPRERHRPWREPLPPQRSPRGSY